MLLKSNCFTTSSHKFINPILLPITFDYMKCASLNSVYLVRNDLRNSYKIGILNFLFICYYTLDLCIRSSNLYLSLKSNIVHLTVSLHYFITDADIVTHFDKANLLDDKITCYYIDFNRTVHLFT